MDPEIQEVPLSGAGGSAPADPDVVVLDSSAEDAPAPAAAQPALPDQPGPRDSANPLEDVEKALENACETLGNFSANVMNFSYDAQDLIFTYANDFVKDLREIDSLSQNITARLPIEVIQAIDKGRNPEHCTYQILESCAEANNVTRGKLQAMRAFRDALEQSVAEQPDAKPDSKTDDDPKPQDAPIPMHPDDMAIVSAGNAATNGF